jgi:excisionase family DNA binding protein
MAKLLTVKEAAERYRVHEMTIRRHIARGWLRAVRVGRAVRIREEDLENYQRPWSQAEVAPDSGDLLTAIETLSGIGKGEGPGGASQDKYRHRSQDNDRTVEHDDVAPSRPTADRSEDEDPYMSLYKMLDAITGMISDPELADFSERKHEYLADIYMEDR